MVDTLKQEIKVPIWLFTLIVGTLISIASFTYSFAADFSKCKTTVEIHTTEINALKTTKVDKELTDKVFKALERIENKLDNHIAKD